MTQGTTLDRRPTSTRRAALGPRTSAGIFPSGAIRERLLALYDAKLARWPIPFVERDVQTRWGRTHVVSAGDEAAPPLVLVHPAGCPAFIWGRMIAALAAAHRVHALDTIGDVGKSVLADPARHPKTGRDYAAWLADVLDALGIDTTLLVGWSMGGWIAASFAADRPGRVHRLALLAPMGLPSWPVTLRVLFRLAASAALPSESRKEQLISWAMGDDPVARAEVGDWMAAVVDTHCKPKLGNPFPLGAATLHAIQAPTLVVLAGHDGPLGEVEPLARRARAHLRDVELEIFPDNSHAIGVESPEPVAQRLLAFLG